MSGFQIWLVHALATAAPPVSAFMRTKWGWPFAESVHFMGLCLLLSAIVVFDLRLLGVARRIPIEALHTLIPFGLVGFAMNVVTGSMFLLTEPDQYVYNPSFHFKVLFLAIAGLNALTFYALPWRGKAPRSAKVIAVISLSMWLGVITAGRLLTFYRPAPCEESGPGFLAHCIPNYYRR